MVRAPPAGRLRSGRHAPPFGVPPPGRGHDRLGVVVRGAPAELAANLRVVGVERGRVAWPTRNLLDGDLATGDAPAGLDDLADRVATAGPEVVRLAGAGLIHGAQ